MTKCPDKAESRGVIEAVPEIVAMALVAVMVVVSTLRLLGILS
jgi:hypothetical protein